MKIGRGKKMNPLKILVLGAKLQGVEALYLAKKAGYYSMAVDCNRHAPGARLADEFIEADVQNEAILFPLFLKADVVLPVIEDEQVLKQVVNYGKRSGTEIIFDLNAYQISKSKEKSNALFLERHLPIPKDYPDCDYPVILKPDDQSGSKNILKAFNTKEVEQYLKKNKDKKTIVQQYLTGRSFSVEVIGNGETYYFPQITEVVTDEAYDCKRIIAPAVINDSEKAQIMEIAESLAVRLQIKGIFDIELISDQGQLKLLEIDARLPSQTPISVYHSTGMNMIEMLVKLRLGDQAEIQIKAAKAVCFYQQIEVSNGMIRVLGEHIMGECRNLKIIQGLFGCKEAITDYEEGSRSWKGIIIVTGKDQNEAKKQFNQFIECMQVETGIKHWCLVEG